MTVALPKLSRLQQRMQNGSGSTTKRVARHKSEPLAGNKPHNNNVLTKEPEGTHIVFMGARDFREYDKTDAVVISITNPHDHVMPKHPAAKAWLGLSFNPVFESEGWFNKEHAAKIVELIAANQDATRLIVHCGHGEYRSRGVALGIHMAMALKKFELTNKSESFAYLYKDGEWIKQQVEPQEPGCTRTFYGAHRHIDKSFTAGVIKRFGDITLVKDDSPE